MLDAKCRLIRPGIDFDAFESYLQAVYAGERQRRRSEIEAQAAESGIPLPMSADMVVTFEDAGAVVDLISGMITFPSGVRAAPIMEGQAVVDIVAVKENA